MFKITKKDVVNTYNTIFCCSYAAMQNIEHLLGYRRLACNHGKDGWNWNLIEITDDVCVITGYRRTFGIDINCNELRELDKRALEAWGKKEEIEKIRKEFQTFLLSKIME